MSKKKDVGNWSEPKQNRIAREKRGAKHSGRRNKRDKTKGVKARKDQIMAEYKRMMWYKEVMDREERQRERDRGKVGNCWFANWKTYYHDAKIKLSILVEAAERDGIEVESKYLCK